MASLNARYLAATVALLATAQAPAHALAAPRRELPRSGLEAQVERWRPWILEASTRFGVPAPWIAAVMRAESAGLTHLGGRPIVSRVGAMGLMQLMPGTWRMMQRQYGLGIDPHAPRDNILAGAAYLRTMYDRFGYPGLFGAYNAGPERYAAYLRHGQPLPLETVAYLAKTAGPERGAALPAAIIAISAVGTARRGVPQAMALIVSPAAGQSLFYRLTANSVTADRE